MAGINETPKKKKSYIGLNNYGNIASNNIEKVFKKQLTSLSFEILCFG